MNVKDLEIKGVTRTSLAGDKLERVFVPTSYPIEDLNGKCVSHTRVMTYGRECQLLIGVDQEHGFTLAGRLNGPIYPILSMAQLSMQTLSAKAMSLPVNS